MEMMFEHQILTIRSLASVNPCDFDSCDLAGGNHALLAVIHDMCVCFCAHTCPLLKTPRLTCSGGQCADTPCSQGGAGGEKGAGGAMFCMTEFFCACVQSHLICPLEGQGDYLVIALPQLTCLCMSADTPDFEGRGETVPVPYFFQNLAEAEYVVTLYQYMRLLGYPAEKISMLTTYNGQKALLKDVVERRCAHHPAFGVPHKVSTCPWDSDMFCPCGCPQKFEAFSILSPVLPALTVLQVYLSTSKPEACQCSCTVCKLKNCTHHLDEWSAACMGGSWLLCLPEQSNPHIASLTGAMCYLGRSPVVYLLPPPLHQLMP
jgi:hypothetical protein